MVAATKQEQPTRSPKQIRRWQQYLANERAEAAVYRELARKKEGEEREILLAVAEAEARHEQHWRTLLGDDVGMPRTPDFSTRFMGFLAKRFGTVFALAMMQTAESRSPYTDDIDATEQMKADEAIHAEVVRGLAARGRERMSGNFRAAVFGANDGLVSNLALVLGVMASGVEPKIVLLTGISGLLSGALSMGAGEYISVKSQNELLQASNPHPNAGKAVPQLDVDANELALVYRARGMNAAEAQAQADKVFNQIACSQDVDEEMLAGTQTTDDAEISGAWSAAASSFLFFAAGALVPIIPFLFGASTVVAGVIALVLVSIALMFTGAVTGILSGKPPTKRALRQLGVGLAAAAVTYVLGAAFGLVIS
jgi:hypothetical protein